MSIWQKWIQKNVHNCVLQWSIPIFSTDGEFTGHGWNQLHFSQSLYISSCGRLQLNCRKNVVCDHPPKMCVIPVVFIAICTSAVRSRYIGNLVAAASQAQMYKNYLNILHMKFCKKRGKRKKSQCNKTRHGCKTIRIKTNPHLSFCP